RCTEAEGPLRRRRAPPPEAAFAGGPLRPSGLPDLVVEAQDRQPQEPDRVVAPQDALVVDVDAEGFLQALDLPDPDLVLPARVRAIEAWVAERPTARVEDERAVLVHARAKDDC